MVAVGESDSDDVSVAEAVSVSELVSVGAGVEVGSVVGVESPVEDIKHGQLVIQC